MMTPQQRAAKTRAANSAGWKLYYEVTKPAHEKVEAILNSFLAANVVCLNWAGEWRLKKGVTGGRLLQVDHAGLGFLVLVDGYTHPRHYSSRFWEVV